MVVDILGFSFFVFEDIEEVEFKDYFIEFDKFNDCKFGLKCIYENEFNCVIKEVVINGEIFKERYDSYI